MSNGYQIPVYRVQLVRESALPTDADKIGPDNAGDVVARYLEGADREHFVVLLLDNKLRLTGINTVSIGTLDSTCAHPREVFKAAILHNASRIILAHNHPSGDTTPSSDDVQITKRFVEVGELIGIPVVDHVIVGEGSFSFYEHGLMPKGVTS